MPTLRPLLQTLAWATKTAVPAQSPSQRPPLTTVVESGLLRDGLHLMHPYPPPFLPGAAAHPRSGLNLRANAAKQQSGEARWALEVDKQLRPKPSSSLFWHRGSSGTAASNALRQSALGTAVKSSPPLTELVNPNGPSTLVKSRLSAILGPGFSLRLWSGRETNQKHLLPLSDLPQAAGQPSTSTPEWQVRPLPNDNCTTCL